MIVPLDTRTAIDFIERYHYSKSASAGTARYGWIDDDGSLKAVSIFNPGNHATRMGVFGSDHWVHVLHHHRLVVHPDVPHGMTSQFQSASLRALHRDRPEVWAVVTYADTDQGHMGTIYQATNAAYTGMVTKGNLYFKDPLGAIVTVQALKRFGTWSERRAKAAELSYTEHRSAGKHRYVYVLGTAKQRRGYPPMLWKILPYPKSADFTS